MSDTKETHYQILRVSENASITEITAAYHSAKQAFSTESVAAYSVMDEATTQSFNSALEEAYKVLSDPRRRKKYDKRLHNPSLGEEKMESPTQVGETLAQSPTPHAIIDANNTQEGLKTLGVNGAILKSIRENRNMSVEDVARITKIPSKFIKALEDESADKMPARVYIQGFVKNLASTYKLNPEETVKAYLHSIDAKIKNNPL